MTLRTLRAGGALSLLAVAASCGGDPMMMSMIPETDFGETASDSIEGATVSAALAAIAGDVTNMDTPEGAARSAAMRATRVLQPASCVTATASGTMVSYTLSNCSGPYGLAGASGSFTATYQPATSGITVGVRGTIAANRAMLTVDVSANLGGVAGNRSATITSSTAGMGPAGRTFTHAGSYIANWDGMCLSMGTTDNTFRTTVGSVSLSTQIRGYQRCMNSCPAMGGVVTLTVSQGRSVTLTFSGSNTVAITGTAARATSVTLPCGS